MTIQVMSAASVSGAPIHVYINRSDIPGTSVSTGLGNSRTFNIAGNDDARQTRITIGGTFGSGSASGTVQVDISPGKSGNFFFPLFSVSSNFTTAIPLQVDHVLRIRPVWTSAIAAAGIGMSVDAWIG